MFTKLPAIILEGECKPFGEFQISSKAIYQYFEEHIKLKDMPNVKCSRISLSEGKLLSHNREYLRIMRKDLTFDICVAPFGTHSFLSWRCGEFDSEARMFLMRIPLIGPLIKKMPRLRTYYQSDAEAMFRYVVRAMLEETAQSISNEKGWRGAAELNQSFHEN
jgi:hypothetical protein